MKLVDRISKLKAPSNNTDVLIEVALFEPDNDYVSARPNAAGTKVVYMRRSGKADTFWAADHTLTPESRAKAIALLRAKEVV
ncbi:hypothetical protein [Brucella sp. NBRC 113783]|uniref:hypothetical protein n=1 Tax=Brucella sp. NBRC 113783 TaxID=3075478 RepID=UPI0029C0057B|nr:hypothetical protein [Brucella sp. NBRC 113783]MDX4074788.1 hypothetical protein [Brucella sp. NBRC 113783]